MGLFPDWKVTNETEYFTIQINLNVHVVIKSGSTLNLLDKIEFPEIAPKLPKYIWMHLRKHISIDYKYQRHLLQNQTNCIDSTQFELIQHAIFPVMTVLTFSDV